MCLDLYTFFGLMEVKSAGSLLRKICEVMFDLSRSICVFSCGVSSLQLNGATELSA